MNNLVSHNLKMFQYEPFFLSPVLVIVLALIALTSAQNFPDGNGQPGCKTQNEVDLRDWRNFWDPTRFWRCDTLGVNAVEVTCYEATGNWGYAFDEKTRTCILYQDWKWTFPTLSESFADTEVITTTSGSL